MTRKLLLAALALACLAVSLVLPMTAFAAEVATIGGTAVIVPWGDWLVAVARMSVEIMLPLILPVIAAAVLQAIYRVYPWAALVLSQRRVEQMGQALAEYGLNAVEGAAKGKTLSVDVASKVVATGVQYGIDRGAPRAIRAAGGPEGVAKLIFRLLDIDESASAEKVIPRALVQAGVVPADQPTIFRR